MYYINSLVSREVQSLVACFSAECLCTVDHKVQLGVVSCKPCLEIGPSPPKMAQHSHCDPEKLCRNTLEMTVTFGLSYFTKTQFQWISSVPSRQFVQFGRNCLFFSEFKILYGAVLNCFTPKISSVILLTVCHTISMMLVRRIWYQIN